MILFYFSRLGEGLVQPLLKSIHFVLGFVEALLGLFLLELELAQGALAALHFFAELVRVRDGLVAFRVEPGHAPRAPFVLFLERTDKKKINTSSAPIDHWPSVRSDLKVLLFRLGVFQFRFQAVDLTLRLFHLLLQLLRLGSSPLPFRLIHPELGSGPPQFHLRSVELNFNFSSQ